MALRRKKTKRDSQSKAKKTKNKTFFTVNKIENQLLHLEITYIDNLLNSELASQIFYSENGCEQ